MLNPITYTEHVVRDFLRYQLTTYPFADVRLHRQMRELLNLQESRRTPLLKGPYVSLSRTFRQGSRVAELAVEGLLHPHLPNLVPYERLYGHQERAIRAIATGRTTLVSTGTGSGKTESFLYPIISRCLKLRDENAPEGIIAVIVYPMNALAEDQLDRMRGLLVGSGVSFGLYIGKTPESSAEVGGIRLQGGASRADYDAELRRLDQTKETRAVHPAEERPSREELRSHPPRILLTNVKQLEYLLTRQRDIEMFRGSRLEYLVFDEAHTFRGAATYGGQWDLPALYACKTSPSLCACCRNGPDTIRPGGQGVRTDSWPPLRHPLHTSEVPRPCSRVAAARDFPKDILQLGGRDRFELENGRRGFVTHAHKDTGLHFRCCESARVPEITKIATGATDPATSKRQM